MKAVLAMMMLLCLCSLSANLVRDEPFKHVQPDGTELSLFVTGDEYYHRVHDEKGYTILLDTDTGYAVYAVPDGAGIKASPHIVGKSDPASLGIAPKLMQDSAITKARIAERQVAAGTSGSRAPNTGTINNIFVFIRFANQSEYTTNISFYDTMCNSTTGASMRGYFLEESNNQLTINTAFYPLPVGSIVRSYQDANNRGYYSPYSASNTIGYTSYNQGMTRLQTMLKNSVTYISPSVPSGLDIDGDNDNYVDNVTFVVKGAPDTWDDALWPHYWTLHLVAAEYINSKRVYGYNLQLSDTIDTGVTCHEMSHSLGFPDLYHYYEDNFDAVGAWDLMEWDRDIPQHHLAYMKWKYGEWFDTLPVIVPTPTATTYTLTAINQSPYSCYKIASNLEGQYYMVEYRRKTGTYENSIPSSGLIVYRIIGSLNGNSGGPPDEVYVYRPDGTQSVNGYINSAPFTSSYSRPSISNSTNPQPWLYWASGQLDGNLQITNIGVNTGSTISFTVQNTAANVWDGSVSTDWHNAANWSLNNVPVGAQYAEIPGGLSRYPVISASATAKQVTIQTGASLTIGAATLLVLQDIDVYGNLLMNNSAGVLNVVRDINFRSGASTDISANAYIYLQRDVTFFAGSNVNMSNGYIEFYGDGDSYFRTYASASINHMRSYKNSPYVTGSASGSTASLTFNGSIYVYNGSTFIQYFAGTNILKGGLNVYAGGACTLGYGTLSMQGDANASINFVSTGNYLNTLSIAKGGTYTVNAVANLQINGNLSIVSGRFNAASYTVYVAGNWTNIVGVSAFLESTSTVVLNGSGTQTLSTETFNNLVLNKAGGIMSIPGGATVTCATYDWTAGSYTVSGGTFTVNDLTDAGIIGAITLSSGTINYTQDAAQAIDLRANLTITGGTFNVSGGASAAWFSNVDIATLTLSGSGILDFKDRGIYIPNSIAFNDNISGGTIRTSKEFNVQRSDFNPGGGTIELYGSTDAVLTTTAGSNFYHLLINKAASRANTVTVSGTPDINGNFTIQAGTFVAPANMNVAGNWSNLVGLAAFTEGTGTVTFDGSGHQYCNNTEAFNAITVNKSSGALRVNNSAATVTCASYTWVAGAVDVLLGTFTANDLAQNGIYGSFYVNPNGIINLRQDSSQWIDLNGFLYFTNGGTINIYGGSLNCDFAYSANAGITMNGGLLDFKDRGFNINSASFTLTLNVTGGTIRTVGTIGSNRSSTVFSGGNVELYGTGDTAVSMGTGSSFYNLIINKNATSRANTVSAGSNILVTGALNINSGTFDVMARTITVNNDLNIYGTLKMLSAGQLNILDDVHWYSTSASNITTGSIYCKGNWTFDNGCSADLTNCTTRLNSDYGADITNNSATARFGNLEIYATEEDPETIYNGGISANSLKVNGNLIVYATNTLNLNENICNVTGNTTINETGILIVGDGGTLTINGALTLNGSLDTGPGSAIVHGTFTFPASGSLSVYSGSFVNDTPWSADPTFVNLLGAMDISSGVFEVSDNHVVLAANATRVFNNANLRIGRGFTATASEAYLPFGGGLYMINDGYSELQVSGANYITNLYIQKSNNTSQVQLTAPLTVTGNLSITSGKLVTNSYSLSVGANWSNGVGVAAFIPGTGTVTFNKAGGTQTISGSNTFFNVTDSHTGDFLEFANASTISNNLSISNKVKFLAAATINNCTNGYGTLNFYNTAASTISNYTGGGAIACYNGTQLNIGDLTQNGLIGSWTADGGYITVNQDINHWIDIVGSVNILNNGALDIYGGSMNCYLAYGGSSSLTISSGEFIIRNWGIVVSTSSYTCTFNQSGGTIRLNGGFVDNRQLFTATGGTVEFAGSANANVILGSPGYFNHIIANKSVPRSEAEPQFTTDREGNTLPVARSCELNFYTISMRGNLTIQAASKVQVVYSLIFTNSGNILINSGSLTVPNSLLRSNGDININNGTLAISGTGVLEMAANKALNVNSGGTLMIIGNVSSPASITRNGVSGYYALNIDSGASISASSALFEYMDSYGVNVKSGAAVDAVNCFYNCTFRYGAAGGKLLTLNNNQTLVVDAAYFPPNTWSGTYNVSKTSNQGQVTFTNFTGSFSGSAYEQDTYNRISWATGGIPPVQNLIISYASGTNQIRLDWNYSYPFSYFIVSSATDPSAVFTQESIVYVPYWIFTPGSAMKFYHVKAVLNP